MASTEQLLLDEARKELGNFESPHGSNCQKYGAEYGFNCVAWCAIFLSILCKRVGIKWRYSSTVVAMQAAKKAGIWSSTPRIGWAAMRQYTSTTGHIGVVEAVMADGTVITIEGNTNEAGSREGDGTYRKRRSAQWWSGYINLPSLATVCPSPAPPPQPVPQPTDDLKERVMSLPTLTEGAGVGERVNQAQYVKNLQALLVVAARDLVGDANAFIDGQLGSNTVRVLRTWQARTGKLTADGVCGPATWAWLIGV